MYRTTAQIESLMADLALRYPSSFTRVRLPEPSVQGRAIHALRVRAGRGEQRRGLLVVGGTHARELMNPDAIVELATDLFVSYRGGTDLTYGNQVWPAATIRMILETLDLWFVPCVNPDGRNYVMTVDDMWRKNRRPGVGGGCAGVDLNRNADVLWGVTEGQTSCSPCQNVYCGPTVFSEPETRNVRSLLDTRRIDCFVDVHSYSELVLYPWGHAPNQSTDPTKVFTSLPTGTCAPIGRPGYTEFISPRDLQRFETVAQVVVDAIAAVRGHHYTPQPGYGLYGTTGTLSDYSYARHIATLGARRTYGFTFETGAWAGTASESFHPADPEPVKLEAKSGIIALAQQCICAIDLIGSRFFAGEEETSAVRRVRDEALATTEAGRQWISLYERVQAPLLERTLANEALARRAAELVRRAATLLGTGESLRPEDRAQARSLLSEMTEGIDRPDLRRDLDAMLAQLDSLGDVPAASVVAGLMQEPPDRE